VFTFPNGGLALSLGRVYYVKLVGGDLFGWKYTEGGYKNGAASFNGKPLLSDRNGNFLFRTYADDWGGYDTNHDTKRDGAEIIPPQVLENMVELVGLEPTTSSLRTKKLITAGVWFQ
jgi:hypothetical protein